ncbi:hypothetical protein [Actinomadura sp. 3N407]|uniref:hypothetical protein n=1 Tax=Actinomadura sp. 3N407 TaxID=3457423 RepID=UPI003FCED770
MIAWTNDVGLFAQPRSAAGAHRRHDPAPDDHRPHTRPGESAARERDAAGGTASDTPTERVRGETSRRTGEETPGGSGTGSPGGSGTGASGGPGTGSGGAVKGMRGQAGAASERRGVSGELADRVAEAAMTCPDVLGLTAGPRGWIATYRAGPPLAGVAVRAGEVEVGVVVRYGRPCVEIADDVRRAVRPLAGRRRVDVLIGDLADDG